MMLINIAFFLLIAAIVVAFMKPKSMTVVWLFSILIPIILAIVIALVEAALSESTLSFGNKIAWSIGGSFVSVIVSIPTIFVCLKNKLKKREQYIYPKSLIVAIIIIAILGLISEWGINNRKNAQDEGERKEAIAFTSSVEKARKLVQQDVNLTKKKLPITQAGFSFTDMKIKNNELIAYFVIDENELNFDDYIRHIDKYKSVYFMQSTGHNPRFVRNLLQSNYDWTLVLEAKPSGKTKVLTLLAKELEDAVDNKI